MKKESKEGYKGV